MKLILRSAVLSIALGLCASPAQAALYNSGHGDIGIGYDAGFDLHLHLHAGTVVDGVPLVSDTEYAPDELTISVPGLPASRPASSAFAPIGVGAGQPYYFLPDTDEAGQPFLGIGSEELSPSDWLGDIQLSLTAISGSGVTAGGQVSLWNVDGGGVPTFFWSSADGLSLADVLNVTPGGHAHYKFGFTQPGFYELELTATGTHTIDGLVTSTATYQFEVAPVPEPTTGLWGLAMLGLAGMRRFRSRLVTAAA